MHASKPDATRAPPERTDATPVHGRRRGSVARARARAKERLTLDPLRRDLPCLTDTAAPRWGSVSCSAAQRYRWRTSSTCQKRKTRLGTHTKALGRLAAHSVPIRFHTGRTREPRQRSAEDAPSWAPPWCSTGAKPRALRRVRRSSLGADSSHQCSHRPAHVRGLRGGATRHRPQGRAEAADAGAQHPGPLQRQQARRSLRGG